MYTVKKEADLILGEPASFPDHEGPAIQAPFGAWQHHWL